MMNDGLDELIETMRANASDWDIVQMPRWMVNKIFDWVPETAQAALCYIIATEMGTRENETIVRLELTRPASQRLRDPSTPRSELVSYMRFLERRLAEFEEEAESSKRVRHKCIKTLGEAKRSGRGTWLKCEGCGYWISASPTDPGEDDDS